MTHPLSAPAHPPILFYQSPRMKSNIFSISNLKYKIFKPLGSKLSLCVLLFFFLLEETPLRTLGFQMISIYTGGFSRSFLNIFFRMGKEMSTCLRKYGVIQRLYSLMKIFFSDVPRNGTFLQFNWR